MTEKEELRFGGVVAKARSIDRSPMEPSRRIRLRRRLRMANLSAETGRTPRCQNRLTTARALLRDFVPLCEPFPPLPQISRALIVNGRPLMATGQRRAHTKAQSHEDGEELMTMACLPPSCGTTASRAPWRPPVQARTLPLERCRLLEPAKLWEQAWLSAWGDPWRSVGRPSRI